MTQKKVFKLSNDEKYIFLAERSDLLANDASNVKKVILQCLID